MRCLEFMKIVEILRLKEMKIFTYRDIADSVGCSKTTVGDILSRCKECCLTYEDADTSKLERKFGFRPTTDLRTGLRRFAEWYKEYYSISG